MNPFVHKVKRHETTDFVHYMCWPTDARWTFCIRHENLEAHMTVKRALPDDFSQDELGQRARRFLVAFAQKHQNNHEHHDLVGHVAEIVLSKVEAFKGDPSKYTRLLDLLWQEASHDVLVDRVYGDYIYHKKEYGRARRALRKKRAKQGDSSPIVYEDVVNYLRATQDKNAQQLASWYDERHQHDVALLNAEALYQALMTHLEDVDASTDWSAGAVSAVDAANQYEQGSKDRKVRDRIGTIKKNLLKAFDQYKAGEPMGRDGKYKQVSFVREHGHMIASYIGGLALVVILIVLIYLLVSHIMLEREPPPAHKKLFQPLELEHIEKLSECLSNLGDTKPCRRLLRFYQYNVDTVSSFSLKRTTKKLNALCADGQDVRYCLHFLALTRKYVSTNGASLSEEKRRKINDGPLSFTVHQLFMTSTFDSHMPVMVPKDLTYDEEVKKLEHLCTKAKHAQACLNFDAKKACELGSHYGCFIHNESGIYAAPYFGLGFEYSKDSPHYHSRGTATDLSCQRGNAFYCAMLDVSRLEKYDKNNPSIQYLCDHDYWFTKPQIFTSTSCQKSMESVLSGGMRSGRLSSLFIDNRYTRLSNTPDVEQSLPLVEQKTRIAQDLEACRISKKCNKNRILDYAFVRKDTQVALLNKIAKEEVYTEFYDILHSGEVLGRPSMSKIKSVGSPLSASLLLIWGEHLMKSDRVSEDYKWFARMSICNQRLRGLRSKWYAFCQPLLHRHHDRLFAIAKHSTWPRLEVENFGWGLKQITRRSKSNIWGMRPSKFFWARVLSGLCQYEMYTKGSSTIFCDALVAQHAAGVVWPQYHLAQCEQGQCALLWMSLEEIVRDSKHLRRDFRNRVYIPPELIAFLDKHCVQNKDEPFCSSDTSREVHRSFQQYHLPITIHRAKAAIHGVLSKATNLPKIVYSRQSLRIYSYPNNQSSYDSEGELLWLSQFLATLGYLLTGYYIYAPISVSHHNAKTLLLVTAQHEYRLPLQPCGPKRKAIKTSKKRPKPPAQPLSASPKFEHVYLDTTEGLYACGRVTRGGVFEHFERRVRYDVLALEWFAKDLGASMFRRLKAQLSAFSNADVYQPRHAKAYGTIKVYAKPRGVVIVDGKTSGQKTPGSVVVGVGRHEIQVRYPNDEMSVRKVIRARPNSRIKLFFRQTAR